MKVKEKDIVQNRIDTVLIVDHSSTTLDASAKVLLANKFYPLKAETGDQALKILQTIKPDLILIDIKHDNANDFKFCDLLKSEEDTADIPVVYISESSDAASVVEALGAGAVDFIRKPFEPEELIARIRVHIDKSRQNDAIIRENLDLKRQARDLRGFRDTVVEDAQKLVALNNKLADSEERLKKINSTKDKFFSIIAHDLKNPLQAVLGLAEMLAYHINSMSKEKISMFSHDIFDSVTHLSKLLENLLQWSRVQSGNIPFKPEVIDIHVIADETIGQYSINARNKNIRLKSNVPDDYFAYGDEQMVQTIIRNLVSNSIKFTKDGGMVAVNAYADDDLIFIEVQDNGVGISPEKLEKMFKLDQHVSTHGTANEEGTGLGLILCKEFIEMNGGRISIDSSVGKGTIFKFYLPRIVTEVGEE